MKKSKLLAIAVATLASQLISVQSGQAQVFKASVHAVAISTNQNGNLTYHVYGNHQIIAHCAEEAGLTNLVGLSLVYDRTADALEVVQGTNHTVVCTPLTFGQGITLSNTNDTKVERLAWVFWEDNNVAAGTLAVTEQLSLGTSNQLRHFRLNGQLQFEVPADGTNPPVIYKGSLLTEPGAFGHDDDDHHGR